MSFRAQLDSLSVRLSRLIHAVTSLPFPGLRDYMRHCVRSFTRLLTDPGRFVPFGSREQCCCARGVQVCV